MSVAVILWWLTPRIEDRRAERSLVGKWEVRLENVRTLTTQTRTVEFPIEERYGISDIFESSQFWRIRNGVLCSRIRNPFKPGEGFDAFFKIDWKNDDEFVATIAGTASEIFYRRLPTERR